MDVVPYRPELLAELLNFLREQFPDSPQKGNPSFFHWRFEQNPLGSSLDVCHVAIAKGRIVGQLSAIRDRTWAKARWWDCCWLNDLIMAPEHRGPASSAVRRLFEAALEKCPLLLVTGSGPKMSRFYRAMRYEYREIYGTYFSVRRPGPLLALARGAGETRSIVKPLLPLAGLAMTALQSARGMVRESWELEFDFALLDRFGDETDDLIARALPKLQVTSYRSSQYLNWKFNQRPEGTHFVITARRRNRSQIDGYMAIKIMERRPHARWAEIVDFLVEPHASPAFDGLLDQAARRALASDVDFLRLRCSRGEDRDRLRAPFWILNNRPVIDGVYFRTENAELRQYLAAEPWHLTSLVSDRTDHGADEFTASELTQLELGSAAPRRSQSIPGTRKS